MGEKTYEVNFRPNPVQFGFITSRAEADLFSSRRGEGKSTALCWSIFEHTRHNPGANWVLMRDTFENLQKTSMKTFFENFPPGIMGTYHSTKKEFTWANGVAEGTVNFVGMDDPQDATRFLSWELAGIAMDEPAPAFGSAGIDESIFDLGMTCLRQPNMKWYSMKLAENNPDELHWTYKRFVDPGLDGYVLWQPIEPENSKNLPPDYYEKMRRALAYRPDLIRRFVDGEFGFQVEGRPVTPQWNDRIHLAHGMSPMPRREVYILWDFGLTPCAIITQVTPNGHWLVLDECVADESGVTELIDSQVQPLLSQRYHNCPLKHIGDPAGEQRSQVSVEQTPVRYIRRTLGGAWRPGPVKFREGRDAIQNALSRMVDGIGMVQVDKDRCKHVHHALRGGWHYHVARTGTVSNEPKKNHPDCVDSQTEILTFEGWKTVAEVEEGDECYGFDPVRGIIPDAVQRVNTFYGNHDVIQMKSGAFDACVTPNHKWFANRKVKDGYKNAGKVETHELHTGHRIMAACTNTKGLTGSRPVLSDEIIRLAAWVFTDGSFRESDRQVVVTQKTYEEDVERLMKSFSVVSKSRDGSTGAMKWYIGGDASVLLRYLMPDKAPSHEMMHMMTGTQRRLFMYEAMRGDGTTGGWWETKNSRDFVNPYDLWEGERAWVICLSSSQADAMQHLCSISGVRTTRADFPNKTLVTLHRRSPWASVAKMEFEHEIADFVWCPTTASGFWIARRNGTVYITGNSDVGDAMRYGAAILFPPGRLDGRASHLASAPEPSYFGMKGNMQFRRETAPPRHGAVMGQQSIGAFSGGKK